MTVNLQPRVRFSSHDARVFFDVTQGDSLPLEAEQFTHDAYLDDVISKPWGHEYRVYCDSLYDIWKLYLHPGEATSTHCHPRKETALLCLNGTGKVSFLGASHIVRAQDAIHIGKGVWHSTANVGSDELELIEVETPRNKLDLVRLADRYGRAHAQYERTSLNADCPISPGDLIGGSKLRSHCVQHRYRFQVCSGQEIAAKSSPSFLFLISLSLQDAINHHIHVYTDPHPQNVLDPDKTYLQITQEKETLE